jgi:hypothetical protein
MDFDDKIINRFSSIKEAAKETGINMKNIISFLTGGGRTTTSPYKWVYCEHHDDDLDMYDDEEWRKIKDYPDYSVSNYGRVRNDVAREAGRPCLRRTPERRGYPVCGLSKNNQTKNFLVSRLVATAFIPNLNNLPYVDHINTITNDNRVENLRWVNQTGNMNNETTKQKFQKPVTQCVAGTRTVIKHFISQRDAANTLKIDFSHIAAVCRANRAGNAGKTGYRKAAGGFNWWHTDDLDMINEIEKDKISNQPPKPKITLNLKRK